MAIAKLFSKEFGISLRDDEMFEFSDLRPVYESVKRIKGPNHIEIHGSKVANPDSRWPSKSRYPGQAEELRSSVWTKGDFLNELKVLVNTAATPTFERLEQIIRDDRDAKWLVLFGERIGGYLAMMDVSTSQIRNAYGLVKSLELGMSTTDEYQDLDGPILRKTMLLKPRLAYAARREGGAMQRLSEVLGHAVHHGVKTVGDFSRFSQFFEAILAYHKAYGGK